MICRSRPVCRCRDNERLRDSRADRDENSEYDYFHGFTLLVRALPDGTRVESPRTGTSTKTWVCRDTAIVAVRPRPRRQASGQACECGVRGKHISGCPNAE